MLLEQNLGTNNYWSEWQRIPHFFIGLEWEPLAWSKGIVGKFTFQHISQVP